MFMRYGNHGALLAREEISAYSTPGQPAYIKIFDINEYHGMAEPLGFFGAVYPDKAAMVVPSRWFPLAEREWRRKQELTAGMPATKIPLRGQAAQPRIPLRGSLAPGSPLPTARVRLAQLAEHGTDGPGVAGSNPAPSASPTRVKLRHNTIGADNISSTQKAELYLHQQAQADAYQKIKLRGK